MAGIGPSNELGYENGLHEWVTAEGQFDLGGEVHWTSFRQTFDVSDIVIQEQP